MLHPRGDLLADVAALAEVDAVQPLEAHLQDVAVVGQELDAGSRARRARCAAPPSRGVERARSRRGRRPGRRRSARQPRPGRAGRRRRPAAAGRAPTTTARSVGVDGDLGAQPVHAEALREGGGAVGLDVDQHVVAVRRPGRSRRGTCPAARAARRRPGPGRAGATSLVTRPCRKSRASGPGDPEHGAVGGVRACGHGGLLRGQTDSARRGGGATVSRAGELELRRGRRRGPWRRGARRGCPARRCGRGP